MSRPSVAGSRGSALLALASLAAIAVVLCAAAGAAAARRHGAVLAPAGTPLLTAAVAVKGQAPKTAEPPAAPVDRSPDLITATSYAFTSSAGVALEDMT